MIQQVILGVIIVACVAYILYKLYLSLFPDKTGKGSKCSSCTSSCVLKDMGIAKGMTNNKGKQVADGCDQVVRACDKD